MSNNRVGSSEVSNTFNMTLVLAIEDETGNYPAQNAGAFRPLSDKTYRWYVKMVKYIANLQRMTLNNLNIRKTSGTHYYVSFTSNKKWSVKDIMGVFDFDAEGNYPIKVSCGSGTCTGYITMNPRTLRQLV